MTTDATGSSPEIEKIINWSASAGCVLPHEPVHVLTDPSVHRAHLEPADQYVDDLHFVPPRIRFTVEFAEKAWISLKLIIC